jgi:hypothetical protein
MLPKRGLNDGDIQGFELFVSQGLSNAYDKMYRSIINDQGHKKSNFIR